MHYTGSESLLLASAPNGNPYLLGFNQEGERQQPMPHPKPNSARLYLKFWIDHGVTFSIRIWSLENQRDKVVHG